MPKIFVEQDCTVEHEGRKFTAGGAVVTPDHIVAYIGKPVGDGMGVDRFGPTSRRALNDWHGNQIGYCHIGKGWPIRSSLSDRMFQVYATVGTTTYTGRSLGEGMLFRGKKTKSR